MSPHLNDTPQQPQVKVSVEDARRTLITRRVRRCQQRVKVKKPIPGGPKGGSPAWIRTTIHGSKGRCPTIRRPGNSEGGALRFSVALQRKDYPGEVCPRTPISTVSSLSSASSNHPKISGPKPISIPRPNTTASTKKPPS